LNHAKGI